MQHHVMKMLRYFCLFLLSFFIVSEEVVGQDCGQTLPQSIDPEAWTWMVAVVKSTGGETPRLLCSGVLIGKRHVLTVAHCLSRRDGPSEEVTVRIGNIDANLGELYEIKDITVHKKFDSFNNSYHNDIALLTLAKDVEILDFAPVCLPSQSVAKRNLTGMSVTNLGYGMLLGSNSDNRPLLKMSSKTVISNDECSERIKNIRPYIQIQKQMICTRNGTPICYGSSGGPLMLEDKGRWYVVGLSLFGYTCQPNPIPEGYTRVSEYLDWIKKNTN